MYIDDLIQEMMYSSHKIVAEDHDFIASIAEQASRGQGLTTRQGYAIRQKLRIYAPSTALHWPNRTEAEVKSILDSNCWRVPLRVKVEKRNEARYLGDNVVALSYRYEKDIRRESDFFKGSWRNDCLYIGVNSRILDPLIRFLGKYKFEISTELEEYLVLCENSKDQPSHYIMDGDNLVCNIINTDTTALFLYHIVGAELI